MTLPALHRQIVVPATPAAAFPAFTDRIGAWWPAAKFSVHEGTAAFRDGELIETAADGTTALWGTVLDWQPPHTRPSTVTVR